MTKSSSLDMPRGQGELVLVVEDNPELQELSVMSLVSLGYRAVAVPDASAAQDVLTGAQRVDVILSDIVLPGKMDGPAFVRQVKRRDPDVRVIFMSGYPAAAVGLEDLLSEGTLLLRKPFRKHQLAEALATVLAR